MRALALRSTLLAVAVSLTLASAAFADARFAENPVRVPFFSGGEPFVLPTDSGVCSFDVLVAFPLAREHAIVFVNPDGSGQLRITGSVTMTTTNVETGTSMTFNVGGPEILMFDSEGLSSFTSFEGHTFIAGPFPPIQDSGFYVYTGHIDAVNRTWTGNRTDVCAALAA